MVSFLALPHSLWVVVEFPFGESWGLMVLYSSDGLLLIGSWALGFVFPGVLVSPVFSGDDTQHLLFCEILYLDRTIDFISHSARYNSRLSIVFRFVIAIIFEALF